MITERIIEQQLADIERQRDEFIINKLRKYIPEITLQNLIQYVDRLSVRTEEGTEYPKWVYLDDILICGIMEPEIQTSEVDGKFVSTLTQKVT